MRSPFKTPRRYTGQGEDLLKYVYLKDDDYWYRILREKYSRSEVEKVADDYYKTFCEIDERYHKALKFLGLIWAFGVLVAIGFIKKANILGLDISSSRFGAAFLPLAGGFSYLCGELAVKRAMIKSIFEKHYLTSDNRDRIDLLLKYPNAYPFYRYKPNHEVAPRYLYGQHRFVGYIYLIILSSLTALFAFIFSCYIAIYFITEVLNYTSLSKFITIPLVVLSSIGMLMGYIYPAASIFKRRYMHLGMVKLLNSVYVSDRSRYRRYIKLIDRAKSTPPTE